MIVKPFGFMGMGSEFDPTLGGTISPYFWYDFTDSGTMTLSGTDVVDIASKGSNTGTLAKGTTATKYTTNYLAPIFNGTYTQFRGIRAGGDRNSCLSRKYGTGTAATDGSFGADTNNTSFFFIKPTWNQSSYTWVASWKGASVTAGSQPEEWGMCMLSDGSGYPGNSFYAANSYATNANFTVFTHALSNTNNSVYFSYDSSGKITGQTLDQYHCQVVRNTSTGGSYADQEVGRNTTDTYCCVNGPKNTGGSSTQEYFTMGGRARNDVKYGGNFEVKHVVIFESSLSDTQVDNVIASYNNAYPADNLNAS